jgi:hypothetical protein
MSPSGSLLASTLAQQRVEVIGLALVICGVIFELLRRKRLKERYAILWLVTGLTLLVLAVWKGLLTKFSHAAGIHYLPSALFAVAFVFVLAMLVHASLTISRLSDQTTALAQRLALLQQRIEASGSEPVEMPSRAVEVPSPPVEVPAEVEVPRPQPVPVA